MGFAEHIESMDRLVVDHLGPVSALYEPAEGDPVPVVGRFDRPTSGAASTRSGVVTTEPAFWCRVSDLTENPEEREEGDEPQLTLTAPPALAGRVFRAYESHVDDEGGCLLLLREVTA